MTLNKSKLGNYITLCNEKNIKEELKIDDVRGISTQKQFINTKADMTGVSLKNYKIVRPLCFAYVPDTSRRGDKISLAFNDTNKSFLVSSISLVFKVNPEYILPEFLFMYFNRLEFDRYSRYNSWGSAREPFNWQEMCDIEINIPNIEIQKKYIAIYKAILENQKNYEKGLDDLKLTCDAYIENLRRNMPCEKIGNYIEEINKKNTEEKIKNAIGVSVNGIFDSKRTAAKESVAGCKIVEYNNLLWATQTTCGIGIGAVAVYKGSKKAICAPTCCIIKTNDKLNIDYLLMWLKREEFYRYTKFFGSGVIEKFGIELMSEVLIPIPDIKIQESIVAIHNTLEERKKINEKLKEQIKNICPILIKGSLEEAKSN